MIWNRYQTRLALGALLTLGLSACSTNGDQPGNSAGSSGSSSTVGGQTNTGGLPGAAGTINGSGGSSNNGTAGVGNGTAGSASAGNGGAGNGGSSTGTAGSGGTTAEGASLFNTLSGKTQQEIDDKISTAVNRYFGIGTAEPTTPTVATGYRCYYELPNDTSMAFIWAADSNDIRSEGMSYGMMIAVQANLHAEFDKLWKFAKTYMQYPADTGTTAWKYYFRWQGTVSDSTVTFGATTVPAPDGDEYFTAALYLADLRWGSAGTLNYRQEADNISAAMLHNAATGDSRNPLIHGTQNLVVFVPYGASNEFTDPSYHLPAFYELFALRGPAADAAKWKSVATSSRDYLAKSANATTGLHPDYATFAGVPTTGSAGDGHDQFKYDAWRVVMNMAIDYVWFSQSSAMKTQVEKYHAFFANNLGTNNVANALFAVDGSSPSGGGSTALTATLAAGGLASGAANRKTYVDNLWNVAQQSGQYRYYQESVYLLGLLAVAGKYNHTF
jgi:oligosaccharide reducing-end xylanase